MSSANQKTFRQRLLDGELLIGTWVKTPSPIVCEVLCDTGLDALSLDAEHAPFGRFELDDCISTARAAGMPTLVRVPAADPTAILNALDCGATGVVVPHVSSSDVADAVCTQCLYVAGGRGYTGSTRAAGFGDKSIEDHLRDSADQTTIIAQIEDVEALKNVDAIAAVERLDCLFIGRIDLTVALGKTDPSDPIVVDAVAEICTAGRKVGKPVGMYVSDIGEVKDWMDKGASLFLLASDQAFIRSGARNLVSALR